MLLPHQPRAWRGPGGTGLRKAAARRARLPWGRSWPWRISAWRNHWNYIQHWKSSCVEMMFRLKSKGKVALLCQQLQERERKRETVIRGYLLRVQTPLGANQIQPTSTATRFYTSPYFKIIRVFKTVTLEMLSATSVRSVFSAAFIPQNKESSI